jgi:hypothetical protein
MRSSQSLLTNGHPSEDVTADNIQLYEQGHTQNIRKGTGPNAGMTVADLFITDPQLIDEIHNIESNAPIQALYDLGVEIQENSEFDLLVSNCAHKDDSRMNTRGIPVSCEVDICGALLGYIGMCVTGSTVTLLDINNSVSWGGDFPSLGQSTLQCVKFFKISVQFYSSA